MSRYNFSTGIFSPVHSDISVNDASVMPSESSPSNASFDETETSVFESTKSGSKLDSFHKRNMEGSTTSNDTPKDKKKNINVRNDEEFNKMLKQSMDELVYKNGASSVLSPVSNNADVEKVLETKSFLQTSVLFPVSNDAEAEKVAEAKDILPKIKDDKNAQILKSKVMQKSGSAEYKRSQQSNSKSSNARNSKVIEVNQHSQCYDPLKKPKMETMRKNLKQLDLQPDSEKVVKVNSSVTELQNPKDTKKISSSILENAVESLELSMSMETANLRRLMLDQNIGLRKELIKLQDAKESFELSMRKELIKLQNTVEMNTDVIRHLCFTIEDLKQKTRSWPQK